MIEPDLLPHSSQNVYTEGSRIVNNLSSINNASLTYADRSRSL